MIISGANPRTKEAEGHTTQAVALSTRFVFGYIMFCFDGFSKTSLFGFLVNRSDYDCKMRLEASSTASR